MNSPFLKKKTILTIFLLLGFATQSIQSQWKTKNSDNLRNEVLITYEVIYEKPLSDIDKLSSDYISDIAITFNKDKLVVKTFGAEKEAQEYELYNYALERFYKCRIKGNSKLAIESKFIEPEIETKLLEEQKDILGFSCNRATAILNGKETTLYYTNSFGIRFPKEFKISGFLMEYEDYNPTLGFYKVKAKKINYFKIFPNFFSLDGFRVVTKKDLDKKTAENKAQAKKDSIKFYGKKMMHFKAKTFSKNIFASKELKNEVLVINFWFTRCGPCKAEIPQLNSLKEQFKNQKVRFIAVGLDDVENIDDFLDTIPFNFEIIPNGRWIASRYDIKSYPTNLIIDQKGIIQFFKVGYSPEIGKLLSESIEKALESSDSNL